MRPASRSRFPVCQFSIRLLLGATLAVSICLGWWIRQPSETHRLSLSNADAREVATVVRSVYAEHLRSPTSDRSRVLGFHHWSTRKHGVWIDVAPGENAIIVSAPDSLYEDIASLIRQLDQVESGNRSIVRPVSGPPDSAEIQRALDAILEAEPIPSLSPRTTD